MIITLVVPICALLRECDNLTKCRCMFCLSKWHLALVDLKRILISTPHSLNIRIIHKDWLKKKYTHRQKHQEWMVKNKNKITNTNTRLLLAMCTFFVVRRKIKNGLKAFVKNFPIYSQSYIIFRFFSVIIITNLTIWSGTLKQYNAFTKHTSFVCFLPNDATKFHSRSRFTGT